MPFDLEGRCREGLADEVAMALQQPLGAGLASTVKILG
jgi:hypothetical protein